MGGFFGTISTKCCVNDLFYGTDYNSHLGTRRAARMSSTLSPAIKVLASSVTQTRSPSSSTHIWGAML